MEYIITEDDLFKYLVHDDEFNEKEIDVVQDSSSRLNSVKTQSKWFLKRIHYNIFQNEHYVLYKAVEMATKYGTVLTEQLLMQFLALNSGDLYKQEQITMSDLEDLTSIEKEEKLIERTMTAFETLLEMSTDLRYHELRPLSELYIKTWCMDKYREIIRAQETILSGERKVGMRNYEGIVGARTYFETAYEIIKDLYEEDGDLISTAIDTTYMTHDEIQELREEEETGEVLFKTGLDSFDEVVEVRKGEIAVVQGGSGVGKTRYCVGNFAYPAMVKYKRNVLYITLEQKSTRIMPLFDSRHISENFNNLDGINSHTISRKSYPAQYQGQIDELQRDLVENAEYGRLRIESTGMYSEDIQAYLETIWDSGFHFDMVVLDYFGLIQTKGTRYEGMSSAINYLKDACKNFKGEGFFCLIAHQLTKEAEEKLLEGDVEIVIKTGGSETQYIPRASDYMLTLFHDKDMELIGRQRVYFGKLRSHNGDIIKNYIDMNANLGVCSYYDLPTEDD